MIRTLIAGDHAAVRLGLRQILADEPDLKVVGEAKHFRELRAPMRCHACDVNVVGCSLPGLNGLDILKDLRKEFPKTAVLALSQSGGRHETEFCTRSTQSMSWTGVRNGRTDQSRVISVGE